MFSVPKKENSFEFVTFNNGADINLNAYNLVQDVIKNTSDACLTYEAGETPPFYLPCFFRN